MKRAVLRSKTMHVGRRTVVAFATALLAGLAAGPGEACTTANCTLLTRTDGPYVARGSWRLDVGWRFVEQDARRYGTEEVAVTGTTSLAPVLRPRVDFSRGVLSPNYHQEFEARQVALQFDVAYGITTRLSALASLPVYSRYDVDHVFFPAPGIDLHADAGPNPSRQTLSVAGVGDALVGLRYGITRGLTGGFALKLPTGPVDRVDEYGQVDDPMHQPGTGAMGFIATLQADGRAGTVDWLTSASFQRNIDNDFGYRFGNELILTAGGSRMISGPLGVTLQAKMQHEQRNVYLGEVSPSTGATLVSLSPGVRVRMPLSGTFYGSVQMPIYRRVNEGQLVPRWIFAMGIAKAF
jgi:hypothetical protein